MPQPLGTNATGTKLYAGNLAKLLRIQISGRLGLKGKGKSQSAAKMDMPCLMHDGADSTCYEGAWFVRVEPCKMSKFLRTCMEIVNRL
jgi:hypothetical protein